MESKLLKVLTWHRAGVIYVSYHSNSVRRAQVCEELRALGVAEEAIEGVLAAVAITDVSQLEALLGADNEVRSA